jgi:single-strand DNA-binding protein
MERRMRMYKAIIIGRLVADPEVRYTQGNEPIAIARYRLAVDRRYKKEGEQTADFIPCIAFGKLAEFAEKYLKKGMKIAVVGRIQTSNYTNKEGQKVYTTDVVIEEQEFAESKAASGNPQETTSPQPTPDGFEPIPDDIGDLPFK